MCLHIHAGIKLYSMLLIWWPVLIYSKASYSLCVWKKYFALIQILIKFCYKVVAALLSWHAKLQQYDGQQSNDNKTDFPQDLNCSGKSVVRCPPILPYHTEAILSYSFYLACISNSDTSCYCDILAMLLVIFIWGFWCQKHIVHLLTWVS